MFIYKIRNRPGLVNGTSINSRAGIYFDYNDVVMTNMVQNTKGCPWAAEVNAPASGKAAASLFPNPATDELTIKTPDAYTSIIISNSIGQTIMQQSTRSAQTIVNIKSLPPGLYLVSLFGEQGREVLKFVKR